MGFRTDVLIADRAEAQAVADADSPTTNREGFSFSGFDRVQLCTLLSLLGSGSRDAQFERNLDAIDAVSSSTADGPVVSIVKPEQVAELARAATFDDAEFDLLVASWGATEEFVGWKSSDVRDLLRELAGLAESAAFQRKCIMIWQEEP